MQKKIEQHIVQRQLFNKTDKLLLAFSGGVDSMVLAHILHHLGYQFELAHCNFKLRGQESEEDTAFCEAFAKTISTNIHIQYFDTKTFAKAHKLSTQMAARTLRYNWFNELREQNQFKFILTAHHANDTIETVFVNIVRGTGINGLQGIPEKQEYLIRPMLCASKQEILTYAKLHHINYREDSSNVEVKYKRNFIRHHIVPQLKVLNPAIEETLLTSIQFFKQSAEIVKHFAQDKFFDICKEEEDTLYIHIQALLNEPFKDTLLFEWLFNKGFKTHQIQQLIHSLLCHRLSGKQFTSSTHHIVIDREFMIVKPLLNKIEKEYIINSITDTQHLPISLSINESDDITITNKTLQIKLDADKVSFPLTLRRWKTGDKFQPLGMKGFKKLSDFFKDQKCSIFDKQNTFILCDQHQIIWIIGHRIDNRVKITEQTKRVLVLSTSLK